jgi:hypothetical protein
MLDSSIMNAMAPEVRERFIRRLRQLEQEQAEQAFEEWQRKRRGPNLREWRASYEKPPELTEWAKHLLAKSKTRQERMEAARQSQDLNRQCEDIEMRKARKARAKVYAKKRASVRKAEKAAAKQRALVQEARQRKLEDTRRLSAAEREAKAGKRKAEKAARREHEESFADRQMRAAYLAHLNEKAERYFANKLEQPLPGVSMTPYNTYGGPTYKAPGMRDEDEWDAYWRLGDGMGLSRTDQLPSEWIHKHRNDASPSWWADASMRHIAKFD